MPIAYALGIGLVLFSFRPKLKHLWSTLVVLLIWVNIGALVWRLVPQLHPMVTRWLALTAPVQPILQMVKANITTLAGNSLRLLAGLGMK